MNQTLKISISSFILSSVFYSLCSGACAQEAAAQEARKHFASGKKLMQEGNYSAADEEFKKAQEILKNQSSLDGRQKNIPGKLKEQPLESGKEVNPPEDASYYLEALKKNPQDPDLHYNLAVIYLKNHRYADAAGSLKKTIWLNPKDKNAYYNLAVLYESYLNDKKQAFDYYAQYLRISPKTDNTGEIKSWMNQIKKELKESKPHD